MFHFDFFTKLLNFPVNLKGEKRHVMYLEGTIKWKNKHLTFRSSRMQKIQVEPNKHLSELSLIPRALFWRSVCHGEKIQWTFDFPILPKVISLEFPSLSQTLLFLPWFLEHPISWSYFCFPWMFEDRDPIVYCCWKKKIGWIFSRLLNGSNVWDFSHDPSLNIGCNWKYLKINVTTTFECF